MDSPGDKGSGTCPNQRGSGRPCGVWAASSSPPIPPTWLEQGQEPTKPPQKPLRARQRRDISLVGSASPPRGQTPSRYLEDVLSRVEAGGAAAHHADPRRRGRRGQPPPQTCRGQRQAGREATGAVTCQGRHSPSRARHPPSGARAPAPAIAAEQHSGAWVYVAHPGRRERLEVRDSGLGAYGQAGAGRVSTAPECRNRDPDPAHRGAWGPAPLTAPGVERGPAGRGSRSPPVPRPRYPRCCPCSPGHVRPRAGFRCRRWAPPLTGTAPPLLLADQSRGRNAP